MFMITKESGATKRYVIEGFCETLADVATLPTYCLPGSTFLCMEDLSVWIFNSSKKWVELNLEDGE